MNPKLPYTPIDCSVHDVLESLATLRRACAISYRDESDVEHHCVDTIVDVYSDNGAEYLKTRAGLVVRLDRLSSVDGTVVNAC